MQPPAREADNAGEDGGDRFARPRGHALDLPLLGAQLENPVDVDRRLGVDDRGDIASSLGSTTAVAEGFGVATGPRELRRDVLGLASKARFDRLYCYVSMGGLL